MFIIGLLLGIGVRLLDIYTTNLGNIFSQLAIWILLGVMITFYSNTPKKAMLNVFAFSISMITTYYLSAVITKGIYGKFYIIGWTIFAFLSPVFAYFTWYTRKKGLFPLIIKIGIILVSFLSSIILFERLRVYDFIINGILIYYLFFRK